MKNEANSIQKWIIMKSWQLMEQVEIAKHGSDSVSKVMTSEVGGVTKNGNKK
ncbi:33211_t:CDS:2 [Gigaspora margarita]|uniref:33211_t:CDS:1 n=1 Tax=Gigaspora margarita TaxID=4874 RepID=A0ABN7VTH4_GIGMA|nr:33211_t:CDS:2 [Gigaspora margarita]